MNDIFDPNNLVIAGVSVVVALVFIVQTIRESTRLADRHLPLVCLAAALAMLALAEYGPDELVTVVFQAIAVAAIASFTVRYVKADQPEPPVKLKRKVPPAEEGNDGSS